VSVVEREPVDRRPVVGGSAAKDWPGLQTNNCFTATPVASSVERIAGDHEHVCAITRDATMSPNSTTNGSSCPGSHTGRITDWHADNPAVICAAIAEVSGIRHVNHAIDHLKCGALVLDRRGKGQAVVPCSGVYIYRPAGLDCAGVHVQRKNKMLLGRASDHCIEEQGPGAKMDNRCHSAAKWTDVAARQT